MLKKQRLQPLKVTRGIFPITNLTAPAHTDDSDEFSFSIDTHILDYRYPIAILFNLMPDHAQLIYINLRSHKTFAQKTMKVIPNEQMRPIIAEYKQEQYIVLQNSSNILEICSLKSHCSVFQFKNSVALNYLTYIYMNNQLISWEKGREDTKLTFWQLFKEESIATLDLPTPLTWSFAQLNSRGILLLQSENQKTLYFVDVINKGLAKKLDIMMEWYSIVLARSTEGYIYFWKEKYYRDSYWDQVDCIFDRYWVDEELELKDKKTFEKTCISPHFLCLAGGRRVVVTDERVGEIINLEGSEPKIQLLAERKVFDAFRFMNYTQRDVMAAVDIDSNALWLWKY